ncbi:hypothetical protein AHiyo1_25410 [Arthrobacter sp. Hiyo1]|nr:hypothetical protein AHiyo1_25410 [Arthrobacter sp. Hiyo1]
MRACRNSSVRAGWLAAAAEPCFALGDAVGKVGAVFQRAFVQAVHFEDACGTVEVHRGAGVACGGEGEEVLRKLESRTDHGDRLQRFEGGPRVERGVGIARLEECFTARPYCDQGAVVDALDQAVAGLFREGDVARGWRNRLPGWLRA